MTPRLTITKYFLLCGRVLQYTSCKVQIDIAFKLGFIGSAKWYIGFSSHEPFLNSRLSHWLVDFNVK